MEYKNIFNASQKIMTKKYCSELDTLSRIIIFFKYYDIILLTITTNYQGK